MGVYVYTRRAETREIDGKTIGRFAFAYKCHSYWRGDPGYASYQRRVALTESLGERACGARDVRLAIVGDFKDAASDRLPVFSVSPNLSSYYDTSSPGPVVGYIRKVGRQYVYEELGPVQRLAA
jgi:hypothetical protein